MQTLLRQLEDGASTRGARGDGLHFLVEDAKSVMKNGKLRSETCSAFDALEHFCSLVRKDGEEAAVKYLLTNQHFDFYKNEVAKIFEVLERHLSPYPLKKPAHAAPAHAAPAPAGVVSMWKLEIKLNKIKSKIK